MISNLNLLVPWILKMVQSAESIISIACRKQIPRTFPLIYEYAMSITVIWYLLSWDDIR